MRYIPLTTLLKQVFADVAGKKEKALIFKAQAKFAQMTPAGRQRYVRLYGSRKWSGVKNLMIGRLGKKCWYTEVEIVGAALTVDHYRPIFEYWFLAFDPQNYRVACPYSNSPQHNPLYGSAGGKGDKFPLLGSGERASGRNKLRREKPVILDPCNKDDCDLIVFGATGRPIINPMHSADSVAADRVDKSLLLLNLDHSDLNSKREQLYHEIADDVRLYEELPTGADGRNIISERMKRRLGPQAEFSTAARSYLQLHRHLDWVDDLLKTT
ncbi:MAG TPA: hypothetical protein VFD48_15525 [Pyrinomonadaceae bacterium]|nr:hypothetical protein [Pyrinomonadaceae bacterium]